MAELPERPAADDPGLAEDWAGRDEKASGAWEPVQPLAAAGEATGEHWGQGDWNYASWDNDGAELVHSGGETTAEQDVDTAVPEVDSWKPGWALRWKRQHCVPWSCVLCERSNAYKTERCEQCGKAAPASANLRIEDAAATKIQLLWKGAQARWRLRRVCLSRYIRRFDPKSEEVYYEDVVRGQRLPRKPLLLGDDDVPMDERDEIRFKDQLEKRKRKDRLRLALEEREAKRAVEREEKVAQAERERLAAIAAKWEAPFIQAERTGELIANWQGFVEVDERVFEMAPRLTLLRLIGNPFESLPNSLFERLTKLRILSLSNCGLKELPEAVMQLAGLEDLNLIRNRLTRLPDNFGELRNLTALHVQSNLLTTLPESFGQLQKLPRLNLEQNPITTLPDSILKLQCRIFSWTKMDLRQLPKHLGSYAGTLVSLSADHNRLRRIPRGLGKLVHLRHLSLCDNQIKAIPDDLCNCRSLQRLWLDWNQVAELPPDFLKLEKLETLHLEGNPMRVPEMDIVVQGVPGVRAWFEDNVKFCRDRERRAIVQDLQCILANMHEEDMHADEFYEAGATTEAIGEKRDLYHAFVHSYLFDDVIPAWNSHVQSMSHHANVLQARLDEYARRRAAAEQKDQEDYAAQENKIRLVEEDHDALEEQAAKEDIIPPDSEAEAGEDASDSDDSGDGGDGGDDDKGDGAASKKHKKGKGKGKGKGRHGQEEMDIDAELEAEEGGEKKRVDSNRSTKILQELELMEKLEDGRILEERMGRVRHEMSKVVRDYKLFEYTREEVEDALDNYCDPYGPVCVRDQPARFRRCACKRNGEPRICVPPDADFRCERGATLLKIRLVTYMEKMRRDSLNLEEQTLEERLAKCEEDCRAFSESEDGKLFFSALAKDHAAKLLEKERQARFVMKHRAKIERKLRKRRAKAQERKAKLRKARDKRIEQLDQKRRKMVAVLERSKGWEAQGIKDKIADLDDELENHPQDIEIELIDRSLQKAREVAAQQSEARVLLQRYKPRGDLAAAVHEMRTRQHATRAELTHGKLLEAYLHAERKNMTVDVRREFRISRRIMFNWMFLNVRMTFSSWRAWVRHRLFWKKHLAMEEAHQRELAAASEEVEALYKQVEHAKWHEEQDPFSDKPFWQHEETGEIVWTPPRVEDCVYIPRRRMLLPTSG